MNAAASTTPIPNAGPTQGCCGSGRSVIGEGVPATSSGVATHDAVGTGASAGSLVRAAHGDDLGPVLELLAAVQLPADGLGDQFPGAYAVAVTAAGAVEAVAGVESHGRFGLLRSVAVAPGAQGRGLGRALTRDRIEYSRERGHEALYLLTTTAAEFFPGLGFQPVQRDEVPAEIAGSLEFASVCPSSASALVLPLGTAPMEEVRAQVRSHYAAAAKQAAGGCRSGCGAASGGANPITDGLYDAATAAELPDAAVLASLGCGNPTALAELRPGEVVLDLGSGGGIDVILSARRVGPTGRAYGLDMTDEMLALARRNAAEAGVANVEFLRGHIEEIPLPDESVDVIISNCVINLSADKSRVLRESFRVLKPGGRFAVSDVVVRGEVPAAVRRSMELWVGCVAGALEEDEFARLLRLTGFDDVEIEPTRIYRVEDAEAFLGEAGVDPASAREIDGRFASAFVRATKPASS